MINIQQKFHLKQIDHEMSFYAYDIVKVDKIIPEMLEIFIPECSEFCVNHVCKKENQPLVCCNCEKPHFQELYLDGWCVGNQYGFLDEDSYYAQLQTGIRVPVNKEIYDAWKQGWENELFSTDSVAYELSR